VSISAGAAADARACPPGATATVEEQTGVRIETCVDAQSKLDGPARLFRAGVLRREDGWSHGVQHGLSAVYDERGTRREERSYAAGRLEGPERFFHASGAPQSTTQYAGGKKHGPIAEWDASGTQLVEGAFSEDARAGIWLGGEAGKPLTAIVHVAGERVRPLDLDSSCAAWGAAAAGPRDQLAADYSLLILGEFERDPVAPIGEIDRFAAARCIVSGLATVEAAMTESCARGPSPLGDATSRAVAERVGECLLSARVGPR
jgi:hypothetical protein